MKYEFLTAVDIKIAVCWNVTPCSLYIATILQVVIYLKIFVFISGV